MEGKILREGYTRAGGQRRAAEPGSSEMGRLLRAEARAPGILGRKGGRKLEPTMTILPLRKQSQKAGILTRLYGVEKNGPRKMQLILQSERA